MPPIAAMTATMVAWLGTRLAMIARVSSFSTISSIRLMTPAGARRRDSGAPGVAVLIAKDARRDRRLDRACPADLGRKPP